MAISVPLTTGTATLGATGGTIPFTTTATIPAGGKHWVVVGWFFTTTTVTGISDGTNTYTVDVQGNTGDCSLAIASADCPAGLASGTVVTATFGSASTADRQICGMYSTGVQSGVGAAYGAVSQNQGSTATWSSTATTTNNGDILIGGSHWEDGAPATDTPSGGNTEVHDFSTGGGSSVTTVYQIGTGASIAAQGTWSLTAGATGLRSSAVAYKAAPSAGGIVLHQSVPFMAPGRI
jgi:hypothetical protein